MLDKDESAHLFDYKKVLSRYESEYSQLHYINVVGLVASAEDAKKFRIKTVEALIKRLEDRDGR